MDEFKEFKIRRNVVCKIIMTKILKIICYTYLFGGGCIEKRGLKNNLRYY